MQYAISHKQTQHAPNMKRQKFTRHKQFGIQAIHRTDSKNVCDRVLYYYYLQKRKEMPTNDSSASKSTILASASAGAIGRLICHPLDTMKSKIQGSDKVSGFLNAVANTWRNERLAGFYRGIGIVMLGTIPGTVIYLSAYEYSKRQLLQTTILKDNEFGAYLLSGLFAEISW